jgi:hypothetical protein
VQIPGVGTLTKDERFGWYYSEPLAIPALGVRIGRLVLEGYDDDPQPEEFHVAIANLLSSERDLLTDAAPHVYRYYEDMNSNWEPEDAEYLAVQREQLWDHVQVGYELMITRRSYGDKGVYVSIECNCDWEPEHGLQLVFKDGRTIKKVGPYDGHLANSDAFGDEALEDVVYHSLQHG